MYNIEWMMTREYTFCLSLTIPPHFPNLWSITEPWWQSRTLPSSAFHPWLLPSCPKQVAIWGSQAPWLNLLAAALPPGAAVWLALPSCTCGTRKQQQIYILRVLALSCLPTLYGLASRLTRRKALPLAVHSHDRGRLKAINLFALRPRYTLSV